MPVSLNWSGNSQRMILMRFVGDWNVKDFNAAYENSVLLMSQVTYPVHIIYDFRESTTTPRDLLAGYQVMNRIVPSNQGVVIYVGANAVIKAILLMAKRMGLPAVKYVYNVESTEDAYRVIIDKAHRVQTSA